MEGMVVNAAWPGTERLSQGKLPHHFSPTGEMSDNPGFSR
jgi:hypothetical protein